MKTPTMRTVLPMLLALLGLFGASTAHAATTCTSSSGSLSFGTVSQTGNTDVSVTFLVTCQTAALSVLGNARVRMCMNIEDGLGGGGNVVPRRMLDANSDVLQFQLYTDAARSQIWGSRNSAAAPTPFGLDFNYGVALLVGGSQTILVTLYGRVPTQVLTAGNYSNAFTGLQTSIDYRYDEAAVGATTTPASCTSGGKGGASASGAFPFTATASVPTSCRAYVATDLDFGTQPGVLAADLDRTSTLGLTCTGRTAWTIGLDDGQNASGGVRRMKQLLSGQTINYALFRNPERSARWGNTAGVDTAVGTGTGSAQALTVYGRVPAQTGAPGSYSDTIVVTIT